MFPRRPPATRPLQRYYRAAIWLAAAVTGPISATAQTVTTYLPPEVLQHGNEPRQTLFRLGMFDVNPHVALSSIYDDNINLYGTTIRGTNGLPLSQKRKQDDFIFVVSPGFDVIKSHSGQAEGDQDSVLGTRLIYNPAFVFFTKNDTNNSIDHYLHWSGDMRLSRLNVTVTQDYEQSAGGVADVGSRVGQSYYATGVGISYDFSEKTSFNVGGNYRIHDYERLISSKEWLEDNAINYQISSKVRLGLGISVGQLEVGRTPTSLLAAQGAIGNPAPSPEGSVQTYVTPSLRASYKTTEKTDVSLSVGGEWRSYADGGSGFGPVFSLTGSYTPWEYTSFSIEAHRREQSSAVLSGQDYVTTGFGLSASRRFRERLRGHVSFTYDNAEYTRAGVSAGREDDYFLLRSGVDAILGHSWTLGVFYQYRVNDSSAGFNFENQQIGLQAVWAY